MTGYVRQSAADIVPTAVVRAAPINNELNALRDAFAAAGGHKHDGTAAEGHPVPVIGDSDLLNKIATDTSNNRHGVFVEVGGAAVEQVRFQDGAIVPVTDNDVDLGTSSLEFKDLYIDGTANIDSLVADTADINGGTVDGAVIGGSSAAAGSFTTLAASGVVTSTVSTGTAPLVIASTTKVANLNVDQLDGADWAAPAAIGTSTPAAGTFTSLTANSSLVAATADINGGTVDGAVIGGSVAQAITGTTVTATTGFVGGLTGNVTGNTTGTHTGAVIGDVTGNVTGNVTASSGSSTFNDVVINGGLNMNAGTSATITNLTSPTNTNDAATKGYVDTSIANLIDSAPGALDTLNELAAALGDDASFSTTVTNSIATKLALAGGTMSGAIAMGTNKITGLGNPTANQDAATKTYVDTADALKLSLTGGTMSGAIAMGTSKITGLGDPTANQDAATKVYVDGILGSATSAAASAAAAATSASNAATSASNASTSASNAATSASAASTSASNAAASYDAFDDRYLGSKASAPSVDNDGNALLTGALYWNSTSNELYLWTGSAWTRSALAGSDYVAKSGDTMTGALTTTALTLSGGTANGVAYLNGSKVLTSGSALTFDGTNLGIGTSSPNAALKIVNATNPQVIVDSGNASVESRIRWYKNGSSVGSIYSDSGNFTVLSEASIPFLIGGGTEGMRLTSTGLGIGTSSPSNKLTVQGASGQLRISDGTNTADFGTSGSIAYLGTNTNVPLYFYVNNSEQMRLTSTGLGIGTSSPLSKLTVNGTISSGSAITSAALFYQSGTNLYIENTDDTGTAGNSQIRFRVRTYGSPITAATIDASGNLGIGTSSPTFGTGGGLHIQNSTRPNIRMTQSSSSDGYEMFVSGTTLFAADNVGASGGTVIWRNTATRSETMRLDSSGNLGLGVTPSAWTTIKAVQVAYAGFGGYNGGSYASANAYYDGTTWRYIIANKATLYQQSSGGYDGTHKWFVSSSTPSAGGDTSFTQAMTLDASGNLGVGTTSPASYQLGGKFAVAGSTSGFYFNDSDNRVILDGAGTNRNLTFYFRYSNTAAIVSDSNLIFQTGSTPAERARIDSSGNFGIGTSSPAGKLDVVGRTYIRASGSNTVLTLLNTSGGDGSITATGTASTMHYGFSTFSTSNALYIQNDGNVGIKTSSPATTLHVKSAVNDSTNGLTLEYNAGTAYYQRLYSSGNDLFISADTGNTGGTMRFLTGGSERARISAAGGFSVGTTADPGAGAIYATGNITAYYSSDIKFKENVRDIPNALATVNAIGGKLFDWTDEYIESKGGADGYFVQKADFGVVAQDVQKVFPIAVRTRPDGSLAVDYEKLGALAFAALVELTKRVEALEAK